MTFKSQGHGNGEPTNCVRCGVVFTPRNIGQAYPITICNRCQEIRRTVDFVGELKQQAEGIAEDLGRVMEILNEIVNEEK